MKGFNYSYFGIVLFDFFGSCFLDFGILNQL